MRISRPLHDRTRANTTVHRARGGTATRWLLIAGLIAGLGAGSVVEGATATLAWDAPTNNVDGTPLTDMAGCKLYYGTASRSYTTNRDMGLVTTATVTNLAGGTTYFFSVKAYNTAGTESGFSEELAWTPPASSPVDHFAWGQIASPQTSGVPFNVTVTAQDKNNAAVAAFGGSVSLGASGNGYAAIGTGTASANLPMKTSYDDVRTEVIYLTNEVGQAGWITGLALDVSKAPGQTMKNWTLRLKHTTLQKFTSSSTWDSNGWTTVCQNDTTVTAPGWVNFTFSTPFYYNGTNNLMADFSFNNTSHTSAGNCRYTTATGKRRLSGNANGTTYGDPLNWSGTKPARSLSSAIPNIRLQMGGPVVISPSNASGFVNGVWTGRITVVNPATEIVLRADDGAGHLGSGTPFDVVADPSIVQMALVKDAISFLMDSDGDGMTDSAEILADTDPYDPDSVLKMNRAYRPTGAGDTGIAVEWTSVPGVYYTVERSTNLMAVPAFEGIVSQVPGESPITAYTDTTATGISPYYYRVQVEP